MKINLYMYGIILISVAVFPCVGVCVNAVCTQCVPSVATRVAAKIYRPFLFVVSFVDAKG